MPIAVVQVPTDGSGLLLNLMRGTAGSSNNPVPSQSPSVRMFYAKAMPSNEGVISACPPIPNITVASGIPFGAGDQILSNSDVVNNISLIDKVLIADRPNQFVGLYWENA
jgi:hypothetical protein